MSDTLNKIAVAVAVLALGAVGRSVVQAQMTADDVVTLEERADAGDERDRKQARKNRKARRDMNESVDRLAETVDRYIAAQQQVLESAE